MIGQEVPSRQDAARTVTPEAVLNAIGSRTGTFMGPSHLGDRVSGNSEVDLEISDLVVDYFLERPHLGRPRARHSSQKHPGDSDHEMREGTSYKKNRSLGEGSPSLGRQRGVREDQKKPGGHAKNTQEGT